MPSLGSSVDAFYDRPDSKDGVPVNSSRHGGRSRGASATNADDPASAGSSQDYSKIAELIRDTSVFMVERSTSLDEGDKKEGYEDTIQRSASMPHGDGTPRGGKGKKELHPTVHKPSLIRKLSGGGMTGASGAPPSQQLNGILRPHPGKGSAGSVVRPEAVKRDTSNQPETPTTKRSIKRVVLSRDQSAVARRLKEEQIASQGLTKPSMNRKLSKAEMLDRKLSVEINKLGLEDINENNNGGRQGSMGTMPPLDRMTTEDVLTSLIDEEVLDSQSSTLGSPLLPVPPEFIEGGDRMTTVDVIAMDMVNGNDRGVSITWEGPLDLVDEVDDIVQASQSGESAGVDADIAEKWLKGET